MNILRRLFSPSPDLPGPHEIQCERISPDESHASAYLRADALIFHACCPTNMGCFACLPCRRLPLPLTDAALGTSLHEHLEEALTVPVPPDRKAEIKSILQHAKVSSWRKLIVESASCKIVKTPASLTITPTRRDGATSHHLPDLALILSPTATRVELAQALRTTFQRCT